ncbi:hypothetical protein, partial [Neisseria gonorrhoeae]
ALRGGGYLDTIREGLNGTFVEQPSPEALAAGIRRALARDWNLKAMRDHAAKFSEHRFMASIQRLLEAEESVVCPLPERAASAARHRHSSVA